MKYFGETDNSIGCKTDLSDYAKSFRLKLNQIGALDLTDKKIMHEIGNPLWGTAVHMSINLFPQDLEYIRNVIRQDRIFNLLNSIDWKELDKIQTRELFCKQVLSYEKFYNDKKCPKGTNLVLWAMMGLKRIELPEGILDARRPYIARWFETVR